jgi:hypothetical protein
LALVADLASGGGWWFYWPLGAWSIALLLRLKGEFFARPAEERKVALKRLEERYRERERKAAAERKRQEQLKREHSRGLEGVVERGVEELLRPAAHRVSGWRVRVEAPRTIARNALSMRKLLCRTRRGAPGAANTPRGGAWIRARRAR